MSPKFNQKLLDILIQFRAHRIAVTADIEKAFLMVSVEEGDRDALRFLRVHDTGRSTQDSAIEVHKSCFWGFLEPLPPEHDYQTPLGALQSLSQISFSFYLIHSMSMI